MTSLVMYSYRGSTILPETVHQSTSLLCWSIAGVFGVQAHYAKKHSLPLHRIGLELSPQAVVDWGPSLGLGNLPDNIQANNIGYGGSAVNVLLFGQKYGLPTLANYPFTGRYDGPQPFIPHGPRIVVDKFFNVNLNVARYEDLKILLEENGPLVGEFTVWEDLLSLTDSRIYMGHDGLDGHGGGSRHSALVVGVGIENGILFLEILNSWGIGWGFEGGFGRIRFGLFDVLLGVERAYAA